MNEVRLAVSVEGFAAALTAEECELFQSDPVFWGDATERAARGAAVLDRVMPGWQDVVTITRLDMSLACRCVLGQIFDAPARQWNEQAGVVDSGAWPALVTADDVELNDPEGGRHSGFTIGLSVLQEAFHEACRPDDTSSVDAFLGFDHETVDCEDRDRVSYSDLRDAWVEQISQRRSVRA